MWYLFFQIWLWLLATFVLGWLSHWFLCCRNKEPVVTSDIDKTPSNFTDSAAINASEASFIAEPFVSEQTVSDKSQQVVVEDTWKPQGFTTRPDQTDDLKRIKGVGTILENTLNELGVYQFKQIAGWDSDNASWVDSFLSFPGTNRARRLDSSSANTRQRWKH